MSLQSFLLENKNGVRARILNYGCILQSFEIPVGDKIIDVVLGFDAPETYLEPHPFFGAIAGRCANRIAKGRFSLHGADYQLAANRGGNHLHGGNEGFDKKFWQAEAFDNSVKLAYTSPDGEEGYPGTLETTVTYSLMPDNTLRIDYHATSDRATIVNLTNHSYFNLAAEGDILDHILTLDADAFTPVDDSIIPTGEIRSVAGTPFDFRTPTSIGERIHQPDEQLILGKGYDHNFVLNGQSGTLRKIAIAECPRTGLRLETRTTEPGVQLYSGNFLTGAPSGKGRSYPARSGFCLETQHYPDAPNKPNFPSILLAAGGTFTSTTEYQITR